MKEVILCAGTFNTHQLLMLSGIGDSKNLEKIGIDVKLYLSGVGKDLLDVQELFIFWKTKVPKPQSIVAMAAKSNIDKDYPDFDLIFGEGTSQCVESQDPFIQKNWISLKNTSSICNTFVHTDFNNILVDQKSSEFKPIWINPSYAMGVTIEKEEDNYSEAYLSLQSSDPTIPPLIIAKCLDDNRDLDDFIIIMIKTVFPIMLELRKTG